MQTPDPPNDTQKAASKQVVSTPHDIPRILKGSVNFLITIFSLRNFIDFFRSGDTVDGWNPTPPGMYETL